jgi:hypothetical protein
MPTRTRGMHMVTRVLTGVSILISRGAPLYTPNALPSETNCALQPGEEQQPDLH